MRRPSTGRRLGIVTLDQAISGASNLLIIVLAAQMLDIASFGLFAIVFLIYGLVQGCARALVGEPLLVHPDEVRERPGEAVGTACLVGLGFGLLLGLAAAVALIWDAQLALGLAILAACMPLLIVQDLGRYLGFTNSRPSRSLILDILWLVLMLGALTVVVAAHTQSLALFVLAWAASGAVAGLLVFWQYRGASMRPSLSWLRRTWMFSWRYLLSFASFQGTAVLAGIFIAAIAGASALGGVQGASLLTRPFSLIQAALVTSGVSEVTRSRHDAARVSALARHFTLLALGAAAATGGVMLALPDAAGHLVLGHTWTAVQPLLPAVAAQIFTFSALTGTRIALLGQRAVRITMPLDVLGATLILGFAIAGSIINGADGAIWGGATANAVSAAVWAAAYFAHRRRQPGAEQAAEVRAKVPPVSAT